LGLIWSFHLQYEQPPSFYLKAPALLYLFIFITLRALRFEVGFVVLTGIVGAVGWLGMVWYAASGGTSGSPITGDYVEYMTSNSVLLGAEFDKVISILFVTFILAFSLARAQRLLIRATFESTRAQALARFVPDEVAVDVVQDADHAQATDGEVREATILFVDLAGFTALSERLAPPEVIELLNDYFAAVAEPLERHAGVITQFQGDAILASFNVPKPTPDHASAAITAALEIQSLLAMRKFGRQRVALQARVGINTGLVVGGLVGTPDRVGYTIHGDAVNLAARLEAMNKNYGTRILVSQRTREAAGSSFNYVGRGTVEVRGKRDAVAIFSIE
ncbi:MAG: adenylate/guanylate cyclase domain-containing protein, partial [Gammaproteobacteria bacterium]|nr:adenylate/guanylate cyclase domain-containing protein [Gammaproteobacteria bacterium]